MTRRQRVAPTVTYLDDGAAVFQVPFDAGWVAGIKALVPAHAREWDPDERVWTVDEPYVAAMLALTRRVFGYVDGAGNSHTSSHAAPSDPFVTLHLRPSAPPELIDGAYRVLARLHHPDRGGTHEAMLAVTAAHDALKARVAS